MPSFGRVEPRIRKDSNRHNHELSRRVAHLNRKLKAL